MRFCFLVAALFSLITSCGNDRNKVLENSNDTWLKGISDARSTAQSGLLPFLKSIPPDQISNYGIQPSEIEDAVLGEPYRILTIDPDSIQEGNSGSPSYREENFWRFPVIVKDQSRALLGVTQTQQGWKIVQLGGIILAKELEKMEKSLQIGSVNEARFILRIYQVQSDFLLISRLGNTTLMPLTSARQMIGLDQRFYSYEEIRQPLLLAQKKVKQ